MFSEAGRAENAPLLPATVLALHAALSEYDRTAAARDNAARRELARIDLQQHIIEARELSPGFRVALLQAELAEIGEQIEEPLARASAAT